MELKQIADQIKGALLSGDSSVKITGVSSNSNEIKQGMLYVAVPGETLDGFNFISDAIANGAVAIVSEKVADAAFCSTPWLKVKDARLALAKAACALEDNPSKDFKLIGVTGTNGKTTSSYLMHHILLSSQLRAGLLGTIVIHDGLGAHPTTHTTPDATILNSILRKMADHGCRSVAMEVSSHGIEQKRVSGLEFDVLVFTNLSQDHLDYHGNMETYFKVKKQLFKDAAESGRKVTAVVNADDSYGAILAKEYKNSLNVVTFGMGVHCDYRIGKIKQNVRGSEFELQVKEKSYLVRVPLIGRFNLYNTVAAIAACAGAGIGPRDSIKFVADMPQIPGRMELVESKMGVSVFVDYAHTPDALLNVCKTLKELGPKRLITVFGCGGDRDALKRPLMAEAAGEYSDLCFVTSDNPRSEDPKSIIKDIEAGMGKCISRSIVDREEAIKTAVAVATGGDIVLIAGKGHEDYQIFGNETIEFDDRIKARAALREFKIPNVVKERQARGSDKSQA